jgi:hemerythrin-like domain-containing protein
MKSVTALLDDHHYIAGMLDVLDACVQRLAEGGELDPGMTAGVRQYFERFVPTHERKEEEGLFPCLERDTPPSERQLLAVLRGEHRVFGDLRTALLPHIVPVASAELSRLAGAYSARKREHMRLEDALLHSAMRLPAAALEEAVAEVEREGLGPTGREWFIQVALDYTDIVATWGAHARDASFRVRRAELKKRADREPRK